MEKTSVNLRLFFRIFSSMSLPLFDNEKMVPKGRIRYKIIKMKKACIESVAGKIATICVSPRQNFRKR